MKKLLCTLTVVTLLFSFSANAYAQESLNIKEGIFTTSYTDGYDEIAIPLVNLMNADDNSTTIEELSLEYGIESETAQTVLNYLELASNDKTEIEIDAITVFRPKEDNSRGYSTKRTYKGYGNKEYYEETVQVDAHSKVAVIASSQKTSFIDRTIKVIVEFGVDTAINSQTMGAWSLVKALGTELKAHNVPSTTAIDYLAALYESKYTKHTYVVENNQKYFGAITEASSGEFENYVQTPGASGTLIKGKREACKTVYTDYYSNPDKKAFNTYLSSGYIEKVEVYKYNGTKFNSI